MSNSVPLSDLTRGPAAKFEHLGDKYIGKIKSVTRQQQRDFDTGKGMVWDNGDPRLQLVITLDTADGDVVLYAKGGKFDAVEGEGATMEVAIVAAVQAAGAESIDPGAELAVAYTGRGKPIRTGAQGAKLFVAAYKVPQPNVAVADLFTNP
jgi:hypothetical protein